MTEDNLPLPRNERIERVEQEAFRLDCAWPRYMVQFASQLCKEHTGHIYDQYKAVLECLPRSARIQIADLIIEEAQKKIEEYNVERQHPPLHSRVEIWYRGDKFPGTITAVKQGFDLAEAVKIRDEREGAEGVERWFDFWKEFRSHHQERHFEASKHRLISGPIYTFGQEDERMVTSLCSWYG